MEYEVLKTVVGVFSAVLFACIVLMHKYRSMDTLSRWVLTITCLCSWLALCCMVDYPQVSSAAFGAFLMGAAWNIELYLWRHPPEDTDSDGDDRRYRHRDRYD